MRPETQSRVDQIRERLRGLHSIEAIHKKYDELNGFELVYAQRACSITEALAADHNFVEQAGDIHLCVVDAEVSLHEAHIAVIREDEVAAGNHRNALLEDAAARDLLGVSMGVVKPQMLPPGCTCFYEDPDRVLQAGDRVLVLRRNHEHTSSNWLMELRSKAWTILNNMDPADRAKYIQDLVPQQRPPAEAALLMSISHFRRVEYLAALELDSDDTYAVHREVLAYLSVDEKLLFFAAWSECELLRRARSIWGILLGRALAMMRECHRQWTLNVADERSEMLGAAIFRHLLMKRAHQALLKWQTAAYLLNSQRNSGSKNSLIISMFHMHFMMMLLQRSFEEWQGLASELKQRAALGGTASGVMERLRLRDAISRWRGDLVGRSAQASAAAAATMRKLFQARGFRELRRRAWLMAETEASVKRLLLRLLQKYLERWYEHSAELRSMRSVLAVCEREWMRRALHCWSDAAANIASEQALLSSMSEEDQLALIRQLDDSARASLVSNLPVEQCSKVLGELSTGEAAAVCGQLMGAEQSLYFSTLSPADQEKAQIEMMSTMDAKAQAEYLSCVSSDQRADLMGGMLTQMSDADKDEYLAGLDRAEQIVAQGSMLRQHSADERMSYMASLSRFELLRAEVDGSLYEVLQDLVDHHSYVEQDGDVYLCVLDSEMSVDELQGKGAADSKVVNVRAVVQGEERQLKVRVSLDGEKGEESEAEKVAEMKALARSIQASRKVVEQIFAGTREVTAELSGPGEIATEEQRAVEVARDAVQEMPERDKAGEVRQELAELEDIVRARHRGGTAEEGSRLPAASMSAVTGNSKHGPRSSQGAEVGPPIVRGTGEGTNPAMSADGKHVDRAAEWKRLFHAFDIDGSGVLEAEELMVLGKRRKELRQKKRTWTAERLSKFMSTMVKNGDGKVINESEFVDYFSQKFGAESDASVVKTMLDFLACVPPGPDGEPTVAVTALWRDLVMGIEGAAAQQRGAVEHTKQALEQMAEGTEKEQARRDLATLEDGAKRSNSDAQMVQAHTRMAEAPVRGLLRVMEEMAERQYQAAERARMAMEAAGKRKELCVLQAAEGTFTLVEGNAAVDLVGAPAGVIRPQLLPPGSTCFLEGPPRGRTPLQVGAPVLVLHNVHRLSVEAGMLRQMSSADRADYLASLSAEEQIDAQLELLRGADRLEQARYLHELAPEERELLQGRLFGVLDPDTTAGLRDFYKKRAWCLLRLKVIHRVLHREYLEECRRRQRILIARRSAMSVLQFGSSLASAGASSAAHTVNRNKYSCLKRSEHEYELEAFARDEKLTSDLPSKLPTAQAKAERRQKVDSTLQSLLGALR